MSLKDKYDIDHPWPDKCDGCGEPLEMTAARYETLGCYHLGCFGYPACSCDKEHKGDCTPETMGLIKCSACGQLWKNWVKGSTATVCLACDPYAVGP